MKKFIVLAMSIGFLSACSPSHNSSNPAEAPIDISLAPAQVTGSGDFGIFTEPQGTKIVTLRIKNDGTESLTGPASVDSSNFSLIYQSNCATLAVGKTCTVKISFDANNKTPQVYTGHLVLGTEQVDLTAEVQAPAPPPALVSFLVNNAAIPGDLLDFGSVAEKSTVIKTISLKNTGGQVLSDQVIVSPPFSLIYDACSNKNLALNSSCSVKVSLSSQAGSGAVSGSLTYNSQTLSLQGDIQAPVVIAQNANVVSLYNGVEFSAAAPANLGNLTLNQGYLYIFYLKNTGTGSGELSDISLTAGSILYNNCPASLGANKSCQIRISLSPTATGAQSSSLNFSIAGTPYSSTLNYQVSAPGAKTLTLNKSNDYIVITTPQGVCGSGCNSISETYASGSTVPVSLTSTSGRAGLLNWTLDGTSCGNNSVCELIMDTDKSLGVNIETRQLLVQVSKSPIFTVTNNSAVTSYPAGSEYDASSWTNQGYTVVANFIPQGSGLNLSYAGDTENYYLKWGGDVSSCGVSGSCVVSLNSDLEVVLNDYAYVKDCANPPQNVQTYQQTLNVPTLDYGACEIVDCVNTYHVESASCMSDTQTCGNNVGDYFGVAAGQGHKTWNTGTSSYGECIPNNSSSCISGTQTTADGLNYSYIYKTASLFPANDPDDPNPSYPYASGACVQSELSCTSQYPHATLAARYTFGGENQQYSSCELLSCENGYGSNTGSCVARQVFMVGTTGSTYEVFKYDFSTDSISQVSTVNGGSAFQSPGLLTVDNENNAIYYQAPSAGYIYKYNVSNSTNSSIVATDNLASDITTAVATNNLIYFVAGSFSNGTEMWRASTTGTNVVPTMVDFYSGSPSGFNATGSLLTLSSNGYVYGIRASNASIGTEIAYTNPYSSFTVTGLDLVSGATSGITTTTQSAVAYNSYMFLSAQNATVGNEIFRVFTGSPASHGFLNFANVAAGATGSSPGLLTIWNDRLFYKATVSSETELYYSSNLTGSTPNFTKVDLVPGSGSAATGVTINDMVLMNNELYASLSRGDNSLGVELYKITETSPGVFSLSLVADINPSGSSSPQKLVTTGEGLYFIASDGSNLNLYRYDGTTLHNLTQEKGFTPTNPSFGGKRLLVK